MSNQLINIDDEINLLDYFQVLNKRKKVIGCIVTVSTIVAIIYSLLLPKIYQSYAVLLPIGSKGGGGLSALAGSVGGLATLAGIGGGGSAVNRQFMALLKSRTLAEKVIKKYELIPVLFDGKKPSNPSWEGAAGALLGHMTFTDDIKNGTILISAEFRDPKIAADIVNGYIEGLQEFINDNDFTVAKRYRIFIENQLAQNKRQLLEAGKELNEFYKGGKVSSVESRLDVPVKDKINLGVKYVNVGQRQGSFGQGDDIEGSKFSESQSEIEKLQKQKKEVEAILGKIAGTYAEGIGSLDEAIVRDIPQQVYLQYLSLRRNLLTQVNTLLTQQYEMAKMEEKKDELAFQVIDPGRVPETRCKPKRKKIVMTVFAVSLLAGILAAFSMEHLNKIKTQISS